MQASEIFTLLSSQALLVGLATTRIAVAFLVLPVFINELIPALVRNAIYSAFLGRLANYVFMAAGGLMLLMGVLIESFALWPIGQPLPDLAQAGIKLFTAEFSNFLRLTLLIAAPMLVVLFIIDSVLGLVNRYAQ